MITNYKARKIDSETIELTLHTQDYCKKDKIKIQIKKQTLKEIINTQ